MRNKLTNELAVCGFHAVMAIAEHNPQNINRLFLREDVFNSFTWVCKKLAERKRPYKICEDEELERICKTSHHQGIVAMVYEPEIQPLTRDELDDWAHSKKTGVVLDSVSNDHNFGAIVRSAAFFDASLIIMPEDNASSKITTSAYRIAEGGMEHVEIRTVKKVSAFIKDASLKLITIGADVRARQRISDLPEIIKELSAGKRSSSRADSQTAFQPGTRPGIALVLGNEETGLSSEVRDNCSVLVRIPGTGLIESLNTAHAASLFLHGLFEL